MGMKTWGLTLKDECRLTMFENSILRRISGLNRDEIRGGW
jgi:hypothetical protein